MAQSTTNILLAFDPTTATCPARPGERTERTGSSTKPQSRHEKAWKDVALILNRPAVTRNGVWRPERDIPYEKMAMFLRWRFARDSIKRHDCSDDDTDSESHDSDCD